MKLNKQQQTELRILSQSLVEWLHSNGNPHTSIVITQRGVEMLEGVCGIPNPRYLTETNEK